jgi:hypothetical protein
MTNDVAKKLEDELANLDGFDGFTDEAEGSDHDQGQFVGGRVIQGIRIAFDNEATWVDAAKNALPADLQLIVANVGRIVVKWGKDNIPIETIVLAPNQKYPDIKAMNEKCPKSEWREYFGKLEGPWQAQHVVYMWDPTTMNKYSWPTATAGGHICVSDIVEKTQMMRRFKKQRVFAVVKLRKTLMSKKYNRQRPDLVVQQWVTLDGGEALPVTDTPKITGPTTTEAKPATTKEALDQFAGVKTVAPPTGKEATGDEIPW